MTTHAPMDLATTQEFGKALGAQKADRDMAARYNRLSDTGCAAYNAWQDALSNGAVKDSPLFWSWFEYGFEQGYRKEWVDCAMAVCLPDYSLPGYVTRACYHCKTRYAKPLGSTEGNGYVGAAIIICTTCIIALSETPATSESETIRGSNAASPA